MGREGENETIETKEIESRRVRPLEGTWLSDSIMFILLKIEFVIFRFHPPFFVLFLSPSSFIFPLHFLPLIWVSISLSLAFSHLKQWRRRRQSICHNLFLAFKGKKEMVEKEKEILLVVLVRSSLIFSFPHGQEVDRERVRK